MNSILNSLCLTFSKKPLDRYLAEKRIYERAKNGKMSKVLLQRKKCISCFFIATPPYGFVCSYTRNRIEKPRECNCRHWVDLEYAYSELSECETQL